MPRHCEEAKIRRARLRRIYGQGAGRGADGQGPCSHPFLEDEVRNEVLYVKST